MKIENSDP